MNEDREIKINLEDSDYVKARNVMIRGHYLPTLKQAQNMIGKLAEFIYDQCDEGLKYFIRIHQSLPYGNMWVSPSDLLVSKLVLKEPISRRYMDALSFEAVIDFGFAIEQKFLKYLDTQRQKALDDHEKYLNTTFRESIKQEIADAIENERVACHQEILNMSSEFQTKLVDEVKELQKSLEKEFQAKTSAEERNLKCEWEAKLKAAVEATTNNITTQFLEQLTQQEEAMALYFKKELTRGEIQRKFQIDKEQVEFKKHLKQVKQHMECKNIANMMYILCMERQKCFDEKRNIHDYYQKELENLATNIDVQHKEIQKLKHEIAHQMKELDLREICIIEILKHYQKFIRFALRASPVKAKFLLSLEKLLLFQLADTLSKIDKGKGEQELTGPYEKTQDNLDKFDFGLEDSNRSKKKSEYILNTKTYVKENFQKLVSTRKGFDQTTDLWSEDVALLIKTLETSVQMAPITESKKNLELTNSIFQRDKATQKRSSFLQFQLSDDFIEDTAVVKVEPLKTNLGVPKLHRTPGSNLKYTRPIGDILTPIDYSKLGMSETNPSLLATRSSLEVMAKKGSLKTARESEGSKSGPEEKVYKAEPSVEADKQSEYNEMGILDDHSREPPTTLVSERTVQPAKTRDSVILRQSSLARQPAISFTASPKDSLDITKESMFLSSVRTKSSRLVTARDSVVYTKSSRLAPKSIGGMFCMICRSENWQAYKDFDTKDMCCEKCLKSLQDQEAARKAKLLQSPMSNKSIKVSRVEVIRVTSETTKAGPRIVFRSEPQTMVSEKTTPQSSQKSPSKRRPSTQKSSKKFKAKPKTSPESSVKSVVAIEGNRDGKEHIQNSEDFTVDRIRSLITIMNEHPALIKLFTACQQ